MRGNADGHRSASNYVGFAVSALSLGLGASAIADRNAPAYVAPVSLVASGLTALISTRGVRRHRAFQSAQRATTQAPRLSVAPILPVAGANGAGLSMHVRF